MSTAPSDPTSDYASWAAYGRERLSQGARRAVERHGVDAIALDALAPAAWLDPRVHAFFHLDPRPCPLAQLLVGYLPAAVRPPRVRVVADHRGVVHLPGLGTIAGQPCGAAVELRWDGGWYVDQHAVRLRPPSFLADTAIELDDRRDPCLTRILAGNEPASAHGIDEAARHRGALARGLRWLVALDPRHGDELCRDARVVRPFHDPTLRSCANISAYGAAFLHCERDASAVFFAEDLAHQIGHITCYALTVDPRTCFGISPRIPVGVLLADPRDQRPLFDAFHGNFTIARMATVLDRLATDADAELTAAERLEVRGRLAQALRRFRSGLASVDDHRLFTDAAWALHLGWWELLARFEARHADDLRELDLSGQPYVFSWARFRARNEPRLASVDAGFIPRTPHGGDRFR